MWGSMGVSGTKNSTPMLVPCWAHDGGFWREKTNPNGKACPLLRCILGDFLGLCRANVGPFWVYVGSIMLGHLAGNVGLHGGLWSEKFKPKTSQLRSWGHSLPHRDLLELHNTTNQWKTQCFATFRPFRASASSFSSVIFSLLLFSLLLFSSL